MELYKNKIEISLYDALYEMKADQVPNHNFEFMISFDEVDRLCAFGKTWTTKNPRHWGENVPMYWIHQQYAPTLPFEDDDIFLANLFKDAYISGALRQKKFYVWKEIK